jgi:glucose-6-phosphate isomerase
MQHTFYNSNFKKGRLATLHKKTDIYAREVRRVFDERDYATPEASLAVINDASYYRRVRRSLSGFKAVQHVVLVGIGGSSLGTEAVYHALKTAQSPSLTVVDALDVSTIDDVSRLLKVVKNPEHIALVIISKSGATTETIANASVVVDMFKNAYGSAGAKRIVVISDEGSAFLERAKREKIITCTIPKNVGGRYSVFTAVGIVPLTLLDINTSQLIQGAKDALTQESLQEAATSASLTALHAQDGVHTVNFFSFDKRLQILGYWYRQLLAESIGKAYTKNKKPFTHQLHPSVSTSVDLHSLAQLYLGGYAGVYTRFYTTDIPHTLSVRESWITEGVSQIVDRDFAHIADAMVEGVERAYDDAGLPYMHTHLKAITEREIGSVLMSHMIEVMFLGYICNVDPFDQPNVEDYKKHMREALEAQ